MSAHSHLVLIRIELEILPSCMALETGIERKRTLRVTPHDERNILGSKRWSRPVTASTSKTGELSGCSNGSSLCSFSLFSLRLPFSSVPPATAPGATARPDLARSQCCLHHAVPESGARITSQRPQLIGGFHRLIFLTQIDKSHPRQFGHDTFAPHGLCSVSASLRPRSIFGNSAFFKASSRNDRLPAL